MSSLWDAKQKKKFKLLDHHNRFNNVYRVPCGGRELQSDFWSLPIYFKLPYKPSTKPLRLWLCLKLFLVHPVYTQLIRFHLNWVPSAIQLRNRCVSRIFAYSYIQPTIKALKVLRLVTLRFHKALFRKCIICYDIK